MNIDSLKYERFKEYFEEHLTDYLPVMSELTDQLLDSMSYSLLAGGKRIRPVLLMAACELAGGNPAECMPYAAAVEFIQTYSLIHDDLPGMDNDDYRRGKPTNHKVFGEGIAILAGDGLLSSAHEIMNKDMLLSAKFPALLRKKLMASYLICEGTGCRGMLAGQCADLQAERMKDLDNPHVLEFIHKNKTAAFIKASIMAGAYLGGADSVLLENLERYANAFGLAFQIVDDIQDCIGTLESRGKEVGKDKIAGKLTYPSLYGLDKSISLAEEYIYRAYDAVQSYGEDAELFIAFTRFLNSGLHI